MMTKMETVSRDCVSHFVFPLCIIVMFFTDSKKVLH